MGLGCQHGPSLSRMSRAVPVERGVREDGWAFLNVQGMRNKQCELGDLLRGQIISVLGLAETWLLPGEDINVEGFKWVGEQGSAVWGGVEWVCLYGKLMQWLRRRWKN